MGKVKGKKSKKSRTTVSKSGLVKAAASAVGLGGRSGGSGRRSKGPAYYAKKIAVMKLKKKLAKLRGY